MMQTHGLRLSGHRQQIVLSSPLRRLGHSREDARDNCRDCIRHGIVRLRRDYRLSVKPTDTDETASLMEEAEVTAPKRQEISRDSTEKLTAKATSSDLEWDWFEWEAYNQKFEVTWSGVSVLLGMSAWFVSSIGVAFLVIPQTMHIIGVSSFKDFTASQQSTLLLIIQSLEATVGLAVIALASGRWKQPPSSELFQFSLARPFEKRYGWLTWALIGIVLSIAVNVILSTILYFSGLEISSGARTVDSVAGMLTADPYSYLKLLAVVGILAPLLEETVFRGFLLTSLMKWMPSYQAVAVSSLLFGCAHMSLRDLPYLTAVGAIWGFAYIRSRNLATPMMLHSFWNSTVLSILYLLLSMGIDLKQITH